MCRRKGVYLSVSFKIALEKMFGAKWIAVSKNILGVSLRLQISRTAAFKKIFCPLRDFSNKFSEMGQPPPLFRLSSFLINKWTD